MPELTVLEEVGVIIVRCGQRWHLRSRLRAHPVDLRLRDALRRHSFGQLDPDLGFLRQENADLPILLRPLMQHRNRLVAAANGLQLLAAFRQQNGHVAKHLHPWRSKPVLPRRTNALVEPLNGFTGIAGFPTNHRAHVQRHQLTLDVAALAEQFVGFERVSVGVHQMMPARAGLNACQHHQSPTERLAVFGAAAQRNRALGQFERVRHIEPGQRLLGCHQQRMRGCRHQSQPRPRRRIRRRPPQPGDRATG
jgi:hypothetical protein